MHNKLTLALQVPMKQNAKRKRQYRVHIDIYERKHLTLTTKIVTSRNDIQWILRDKTQDPSTTTTPQHTHGHRHGRAQARAHTHTNESKMMEGTKKEILFTLFFEFFPRDVRGSRRLKK